MANRRFEMFQFRQILTQMRLGHSDRQIAKAKLMGRRKAAQLRALAQQQGWLDPGRELPDDAELAKVIELPPTGESAVPMLLPYREQLKTWQAAGINGTTMYQALVREHGFAGSYSSVRRFLQALKEDNPQATVMLDFDPGEAAQVDFGSGPKLLDPQTGKLFSTWVFVMTLAFSRHQYAEIVRDQKVATWLGCHRRAFEFFSGVPAKIMLDNLKAGIIKACWHDPAVNRSYAEFAEGYGFLISPCPPRQPQMKGRVESGVKYVKNNFLPLRTFRNLVDANRQLHEWVLETAGNRIHGTTKQKPLIMFAEAEKTFLKALPAVAPELAVWAEHKLHGNCHLQFEKAYYSAPFKLVHKQLWVKATETTVKIYHQHQQVAAHPRCVRPGQKATCIDHLPPDAVAYLMRDPQWCLKQAGEIGPRCHSLIHRLLSHRVVDHLRAAQGVIRLAGKYGPERLEAACHRALAYDSPQYITVKTILSKGLDQQPSETESVTVGMAYRGQGRFQRQQFFH